MARDMICRIRISATAQQRRDLDCMRDMNERVLINGFARLYRP